MRLTKATLFIISALVVCSAMRPTPAQTAAPERCVVIAAGTMLDGHGRVPRATRVVVYRNEAPLRASNTGRR